MIFLRYEESTMVNLLFSLLLVFESTNASFNQSMRASLQNTWKAFSSYFHWMNPSQWPNPFNTIKNSSLKTKVIVGTVGALVIGAWFLYPKSRGGNPNQPMKDLSVTDKSKKVSIVPQNFYSISQEKKIEKDIIQKIKNNLFFFGLHYNEYLKSKPTHLLPVANKKPLETTKPDLNKQNPEFYVNLNIVNIMKYIKFFQDDINKIKENSDINRLLKENGDNIKKACSELNINISEELKSLLAVDSDLKTNNNFDKKKESLIANTHQNKAYVINKPGDTNLPLVNNFNDKFPPTAFMPFPNLNKTVLVLPKDSYEKYIKEPIDAKEKKILDNFFLAKQEYDSSQEDNSIIQKEISKEKISSNITAMIKIKEKFTNQFQIEIEELSAEFNLDNAVKK